MAETIPVTLRSLAPTGTTSFSGVLTGGNGRSVVNGETEYYQVDVPTDAPALNAYVTLADNPDNQVNAWLIDPSGQAEAYQSNELVTVNNGQLEGQNTLGTNLHVVNPAAGRWTLAIDFAPAVSGTALSEPFTVNLNQTAPNVKASGIPPNGVNIPAGHSATVTLKVTNNGTAPEAYFVDGRTNTQATYNLVSVTSPDSQAPLTFADNFPQYLVPSQTTSITAEATTDGTEPIQFDMSTPAGDPDVASGQGLDVTASAAGFPLTPGEWSVLPSVVGPFTAPASTENVTTSMTATTEAFDPAVTSNTGDLWQLAVGGPLTVSPVVVQPGQSANINVTIAPTGAKGTTGSGVLYLDDDSFILFGAGLVPNANTVAAIPYSYTVK